MFSSEYDENETEIFNDDYENQFEKHLVQMEEILNQICIYEEAFMREVQAYAKCLNQNLYHLHDRNRASPDGTHYAKCFLRVEKKRTDASHRYLYWCSMTARKGRKAYDDLGRRQFMFRKIRRPQGYARLQGKLQKFAPDMQDYIRTYDPFLAVMDRALTLSASSVSAKRAFVKFLHTKLRPGHQLANMKFFPVYED